MTNAPADAIARLVAALEAGPTPGPWTCMAKLDKSFVDHGYRRVAEATKGGLVIYAETANMRFDNGWQWGDDGPFIAACREGVPALLARIAELERALRGLIDVAEDYVDTRRCTQAQLRKLNQARAALAASGTGGKK